MVMTDHACISVKFPARSLAWRKLKKTIHIEYRPLDNPFAIFGMCLRLCLDAYVPL